MTITITDLDEFNNGLQTAMATKFPHEKMSIRVDVAMYLEENLRAYTSLRDDIREALKEQMKEFAKAYEWKDEIQ